MFSKPASTMVISMTKFCYNVRFMAHMADRTPGSLPVISARKESDPAQALPMSRFRLVYSGDVERAGYTGSAWRGTMGHALKRLVCVARGQECPACFLYRSCVYPYIFETPPPEDTSRMRLYPAAPHPFVLAPFPALERGESAVLLTLFGKAGQYLAYLLHAMRSAGERQRRGPAELVRVYQETRPGGESWELIHTTGSPVEPFTAAPVRVPDPPRLAALTFESPLRLRHDERYLGAEKLELSDLLRNLVRRVSALAYFHADTDLTADFPSLRDRALQTSWLDCRLRWQEQTRYSSRQRRKVPSGGVCGVAMVETGKLGDLWPYLWLGQFTFAGKGTSMGMGRYRLRRVTGAG